MDFDVRLKNMPEEIVNLLKEEAISNYLVFGGGLLVGLLVAAARHYFRKRPRIEAARVSSEKLFDCASTVKDRLTFSYKGMETDELHGSDYTFRNLGSETLEDISITLDLEYQDGDVDFLDFDTGEDADPSRKMAVGFEAKKYPDSDRVDVTVHIPYLNCYKDHSDIVRVRMYSNTPVTTHRISGTGRGWSVKYVDKFGLWKNLEKEILENRGFFRLSVSMVKAFAVRFKV